MKYKDQIISSMNWLNNRPNTLFIGYNLKYGSKGYGTLNNVSTNKILEMPVAESLMAGVATGVALNGKVPILIFERHDFILNALDQLVNMLDKISILSEEQYNPTVIIRAIVGASKPFNAGIQHSADYSSIFQNIFKTINVICPTQDIIEQYQKAYSSKNSTMFIEYRNWYDTDF